MSARATYTTPDGYLMAWDDIQGRYRPAHVLVWEQAHGRSVRPAWHVHHKDADRRNNRPENLQELDPATHRRLHAGWLLDDDARWWKRCRGSCGELKLLDEFYARANGQTYSYCRCCHTAINRTNEAISRQRSRAQRRAARPLKDAAKAERLRQAGWKVIRVREKPLDALSDSDVVVPARANVHTITVAVLEQIERLGTPVPGLTAYRATGQTRADRGEELETLATPELLDAVCGGHHWEKFHEGLSRLEPTTVGARAAYLYGCLGNNWRSYPSLLGCDSAVLQVKFEELDRRYGRRWRKQPSLLGRNLGTLATNAAYLDEIFGDRRWLGIPLLLTMDPQTLRPRAAALDARFGSRRWIEQPQLLAREPSTLSRNAALLDKRFGAFPWCGQVALVGRNPETLRATADYLDSLFPDRPWQGRPQLLKQKPETLQAKADLYARLTKNAPLSPRALTLSAATMARRARELAAQVGRRRAARWLHESPYLLDDPRACARRVARELPSAA